MQESIFLKVQSIVQFVLEIGKLKRVLCKTKPIGEERYDNTAEHNWKIVIFAPSLAKTLWLSVD